MVSADIIQSHKARRRLKRKRWQKKKIEQSAEKRRQDRERRNEKRVEQLLQNRGLDKPAESVEPARDRSKILIPVCRPKEIVSSQIHKTSKFLGGGSFGMCYLAFYRGLQVVIKEVRILRRGNETEDQANKRTKREVLQEADTIVRLGDHPGLPLLFGVCTKVLPLRIVLQFLREGSTKERYEAKFAQLSSESSSNNSDISASSEQRNSTKKRKCVKKKNGKKKSKGKAEKAHEAMCKKAMKTLDKVNALLDKYGDSRSTE
ncbi:hypothetical protein AC249_AIPGENE7866 [Exaiptasia diaphana]|nr:hypothetical protein AC249_AIPGENE7866 [Exaiptasia diaphana]